MLYRHTTILSVRHASASIINRIAAQAPQQFPFDRFQSVCYEGLTRKIDGVVEMMLLESVLCYLSWLASEDKNLGTECGIMSYLIEEIRKESFEDVNHVCI